MILDPITKYHLASTAHRTRVEAATHRVFTDRDRNRRHIRPTSLLGVRRP